MHAMNDTKVQGFKLRYDEPCQPGEPVSVTIWVEWPAGATEDQVQRALTSAVAYAFEQTAKRIAPTGNRR